MTINIPKNADGGWWKPQVAAKPGDIITLGNLSYGFLTNLVGTPENPIVLVADQSCRIGAKDNSIGFGLILENCKHIRVLGNEKLSIGSGPSNWIAQGLGLPFCSDVHIEGIEFSQTQAAIFSNPKTGGPFFNYKILNCKFHDIDNYGVDRWNSAGIYIGNTDIKEYGSAGTYNNIEVAFCTFENLSADGMQITVTNGASIHDNTIKKFGIYNGDGQRTAIVLGGCTSGVVFKNTIEDGTGPAVSSFGCGLLEITQNKIARVASNPIEPVIYINSKCVNGPKHQVSVTNNSLDKVYNRFIMDDSKSLVLDKGNVVGVVPPPPPPIDPPPVDIPPVGKPEVVIQVFNNGKWGYVK